MCVRPRELIYWIGDRCSIIELPGMTTALLLTSLGLGLRHGIDWDHIAAIADLSATADTRRRGFVLSFLYAAGHGVVVMVLGTLAILFGASLPDGVDVWMGRVVGVTLIALGAWVLIELIRKGRDFRLRSRWILVIGGTFAGLRRVREATARRKLTIEHEHDHPHDHSHEVIDLTDDHAQPFAHDHAHLSGDADEEERIDLTELEAEVAEVGSATASANAGSVVTETGSVGGRWFGWARGGRGLARSHGLGRSHGPGDSHGPGLRHSHRHRHETRLADSATGTGNGTAAGIGLLHGIGFESPTQIAVFVASTSVVGAWAGFGLLAAWVVGLIVANSGLALLAAYGLLGAERNFVIYATVAVLVGVISLTMGVLLLLGIDNVLPELT